MHIACVQYLFIYSSSYSSSSLNCFCLSLWLWLWLFSISISFSRISISHLFLFTRRDRNSKLNASQKSDIRRKRTVDSKLHFQFDLFCFFHLVMQMTNILTRNAKTNYSCVTCHTVNTLSHAWNTFFVQQLKERLRKSVQKKRRKSLKSISSINEMYCELTGSLEKFTMF